MFLLAWNGGFVSIMYIENSTISSSLLIAMLLVVSGFSFSVGKLNAFKKLVVSKAREDWYSPDEFYLLSAITFIMALLYALRG